MCIFNSERVMQVRPMLFNHPSNTRREVKIMNNLFLLLLIPRTSLSSVFYVQIFSSVLCFSILSSLFSWLRICDNIFDTVLLRAMMAQSV
jgi:hypothetical protein